VGEDVTTIVKRDRPADVQGDRAIRDFLLAGIASMTKLGLDVESRIRQTRLGQRSRDIYISLVEIYRNHRLLEAAQKNRAQLSANAVSFQGEMIDGLLRSTKLLKLLPIQDGTEERYPRRATAELFHWFQDCPYYQRISSIKGLETRLKSRPRRLRKGLLMPQIGISEHLRS